jgi:hypothetical protein
MPRIRIARTLAVLLILLYLGLHTNMCLFGKPGALKYMHQAGPDDYPSGATAGLAITWR